MRPSCSEASSSPIVTMSDVAERLGQEISTIAHAVQHLQGLMSPLIYEAAARTPAHLQEMQDFDHIAQKLSNLSNFLITLATHVPAHWCVDPTTAVQVVTLSQLSSRLGFANEPGAAEDHTPGDFELF
jgi:hypothetical protein